MTQQTERRTCYLYVLNTLADWEIGFITAELRSNRYVSKKMKYEIITVGNSLEPTVTMGGMTITPERPVEDVEFKEGDLLVLPGADTWMEEANRKILNILPGLLDKRVIVAAICDATFALAQIGLLNRRKHTSNDKGYLKAVCSEYSGDSLYIDDTVVVDDNLITATGLAPLEFSREVFRETGAMKEETLEAWYQLYRTREPQYFYNLMESLK